DFYQGTELWDLHLVDPDNRRPVHYEEYRQALGHIRASQQQKERLTFIHQLLENPNNGHLKLWITTMALHFRKKHASLFLDGQFQPIESEGPQSPHVCAFGRIQEEHMAITMIPRFISNLCQQPGEWPIGTEIWKDTFLRLPHEWVGTQFSNVFTGETIASTQQHDETLLPLDKVLQHFPIALLERAT
ncbi:MAG: malto-oligosyltrehalose synthase, partial [Nitrospirales bacterium]